jgi:hypothetical protein
MFIDLNVLNISAGINSLPGILPGRKYRLAAAVTPIFQVRIFIPIKIPRHAALHEG